MYFRPCRLGLIKFLGLWASNNASTKSNSDGTPNEVPNKSINKDNTSVLLNKPKTSSKSIENVTERVVALMLEKGIPGMTICVSKEGETLWHSSFGYCDVENQVLCQPDARMRIASISKALFSATIIAPMIEKNQIDLKASIYKYMSHDEFPKPKFEGSERDITVEQLLSHTSGIRHYDETIRDDQRLLPIGSKGARKIYQSEQQFERKEYYQRKTFRNVIEALEPFKNTPLRKEPGDFAYTTYGFTLLSAVAQKAHQFNPENKNEQIEDFWVKVLKKDWNLDKTDLDYDEPILTKRARYYLRKSHNGTLINAPYQDSSIKWAGGGIISTTGDLVKFGNTLVDSYKGRESGILKRQTLDRLWTVMKENYGLGFMIKPLSKTTWPEETVAVFHTGAALGGSSVLMIFPETEIVVAVLVNLGEVNLEELALFTAEQFK